MIFNRYKSIVISDVHLGTSKDYLKMIKFLKAASCNSLIFCGDVINGLTLNGSANLKKIQNTFIKTLLEISCRDNTQIIFIVKEDVMLKTTDLTFGRFSFFKNFSFSSAGKHYYVLPGDIGAFFNKNNLSFFSPDALRYNFLLWLNYKYNKYNLKNGKNYASLFRRFPSLKKDGDVSYTFLSHYKNDLIKLAALKECEIIIGGHLHFPGIYYFGDVAFLNPGYWSESLTALAETNGGLWKVLEYEKVMEEKKEADKYVMIQEKLFKDHNYENYTSQIS